MQHTFTSIEISSGQNNRFSFYYFIVIFWYFTQCIMQITMHMAHSNPVNCQHVGHAIMYTVYERLIIDINSSICKKIIWTLNTLLIIVSSIIMLKHRENAQCIVGLNCFCSPLLDHGKASNNYYSIVCWSWGCIMCIHVLPKVSETWPLTPCPTLPK